MACRAESGECRVPNASTALYFIFFCFFSRAYTYVTSMSQPKANRRSQPPGPPIVHLQLHRHLLWTLAKNAAESGNVYSYMEKEIFPWCCKGAPFCFPTAWYSAVHLLAVTNNTTTPPPSTESAHSFHSHSSCSPRFAASGLFPCHKRVAYILNHHRARTKTGDGEQQKGWAGG